jgi:hypothetical protein
MSYQEGVKLGVGYSSPLIVNALGRAGTFLALTTGIIFLHNKDNKQ